MPGSNPTMLETTAVKDGDDYVINGHKWYHHVGATVPLSPLSWP